LAIRPEAWQINPASTGLPAKVLKHAFLGPFCEVTLSCEVGRLWLQMPARDALPQVGDVIGLTLGDVGVMVLPEPQSTH
jgi:hypothetical protein